MRNKFVILNQFNLKLLIFSQEHKLVVVEGHRMVEHKPVRRIWDHGCNPRSFRLVPRNRLPTSTIKIMQLEERLLQ